MDFLGAGLFEEGSKFFPFFGTARNQETESVVGKTGIIRNR
jgi:RsiW-degrading membrane proteinase PrsW (M82 family)